MSEVKALNTRVLVLNKLWQVIDVCSVKRAFCLLYLKHAQVVLKKGGSFYTFGFEEWRDFSQNSTEDGDIIRTITYKLKIPRVILLLIYDKIPPREVKFTRKNIYKRDRNTCQYCGRRFKSEDLNLDHVIPLSRGGKDTWENVVCSCVQCNLRKGNKTLAEAGMKLIRKPRKPRWDTFVKESFIGVKEESWKDFLDLAYWNIELEQDKD
ncbi:HNH endonuclease [Candidatus Aerophobetes bacterium]|uniref:HNH endonuclease n=1 Tax=Aerophobetes bacterium TaxID=2030807 RepID=A0A662D6C9_UNCAE|nr:MAG: HNH endonuclease [Candidatus Aerophobetes bacterium]